MGSNDHWRDTNMCRHDILIGDPCMVYYIYMPVHLSLFAIEHIPMLADIPEMDRIWENVFGNIHPCR